MSNSEISLLLVGDLILDEPEPDSFFDLSRHILRQGDVVAGHVEVPHTTRGIEQGFDVPVPPSDPANLEALRRAGFHLATLAGNHMADVGPAGIEDTMSKLRSLGIKTTGAGMNLNEARSPAIIEREGLKIGFLSYNCVGPRDAKLNAEFQWDRDRVGIAL